jgi:hypothetical protein
MPSYNALLFYMVVGAIAGVARDVMSTGGLALPSKEDMPDGVKILRLGFLASILLGAIVACVVDGNWITAAAAAFAGPEALERLLNFKAMRKRKVNSDSHSLED